MSIQKRTVYFDTNDGVVKFWDWARVGTTLGTMVEPFCPNVRHNFGSDFQEYDPADEMVRVDEMRAIPFDVEQHFLSDGLNHFHGGRLLPREGR